MAFQDTCKGSECEWETPQKARIQGAHFDNGLNPTQIFKKYDIHISSVKWLLFTSDDWWQSAHRDDRLRKLSEKDVKRVIEFLKENYKRRVMLWETLAVELELNCFKKTLQRSMRKQEYKKCIACSKPYVSEAA